MRPAIEQHRAEFQCDHAERELLQHGGRDGGMLARQPEVRLDLLFPRVEILLHLAGEDLAELGIDAADVGSQRLNQGQQNAPLQNGSADSLPCLLAALLVRLDHGRSISPASRSRARSSLSRRAICPLSRS